MLKSSGRQNWALDIIIEYLVFHICSFVLLEKLNLLISHDISLIFFCVPIFAYITDIFCVFPFFFIDITHVICIFFCWEL